MDLQNIVDQVLKKFPEKVKEYRAGKTGLFGMFAAEVMILSKGQANPKHIVEVLNVSLK